MKIQNSTRETFVQIESDLAQGDFLNGANRVALLSPQNAIETTYKSIFDAYIKNAGGVLTAADSIALVAIANGCPFRDGVAVYEARALYNMIYKTVRIFEDNCPPSSARLAIDARDSALSSFDVALYPNPSNGTVFLKPVQKNSGRVQIVITDITGKEVYNSKVEFKENTIELNLNIESGIYQLRIVNETTNEQLVKQLVIQQ
jgi:hypothetical protein